MFSIIIPAYNAEKTIGSCLDSVLKQTYSDYECIIVNDGSRDGTKKIIEEYITTYKNIVLVDKLNGGVSEARNTGIEETSGKYILFLDSDDCIDEACLEKLYFEVKEEKPDVLVFGSRIILAENKETSWGALQRETTSIYDVDEETWSKALSYGLLNTCWGKLFKRESIDRVRFSSGINWGEDTAFTLAALKCAGTVKFISYPGYIHFSYMDGLDNKFNRQKPNLLNRIYTELFSFQDEFHLTNGKWDVALALKISQEIMRAINALSCQPSDKDRDKKYISELFQNSKVTKSFKVGIAFDNNPMKLKVLSKINSVLIWEAYIDIWRWKNSKGNDQ